MQGGTLHPEKLAVLHYNRALALEKAGRYEEAAAEYREAIRLDPSDVASYVNLGLVLRELELDEEANRAFEAALELRKLRSGSGNIKL